MTRIHHLALVAVLGGAVCSSAWALKPDSEDSRAFLKAPVSLTQAIATAEKQAGGKAFDAEFDHSNQHGWVYEVKVLNGQSVWRVKVDAEKGQIVSSQERQGGSRRQSRDAK